MSASLRRDLGIGSCFAQTRSHSLPKLIEVALCEQFVETTPLRIKHRVRAAVQCRVLERQSDPNALI